MLFILNNIFKILIKNNLVLSKKLELKSFSSSKIINKKLKRKFFKSIKIYIFIFKNFKLMPYYTSKIAI